MLQHWRHSVRLLPRGTMSSSCISRNTYVTVSREPSRNRRWYGNDASFSHDNGNNVSGNRSQDNRNVFKDKEIFDSIIEMVQNGVSKKTQKEDVNKENSDGTETGSNIKHHNFMQEILLKLEESTKQETAWKQSSVTNNRIVPNDKKLWINDTTSLIAVNKFIELVQDQITTDWGTMNYLTYMLKQFKDRDKSMDTSLELVKPVAVHDIYKIPEPLMLTVPYIIPRLITSHLPKAVNWPPLRQLQMYEYVINFCLEGGKREADSVGKEGAKHHWKDVDACDMTTYIAVCNTEFYNNYLTTSWLVHQDTQRLQHILNTMQINGVFIDEQTEKIIANFNKFLTSS